MVQYGRVNRAGVWNLRQRGAQFPPWPKLLGLGYVGLPSVPDRGRTAIRVSCRGLQFGQPHKPGSARQHHHRWTVVRHDQRHCVRQHSLKPAASDCSEVYLLRLSTSEQIRTGATGMDLPGVAQPSRRLSCSWLIARRRAVAAALLYGSFCSWNTGSDVQV